MPEKKKDEKYYDRIFCKSLNNKSFGVQTNKYLNIILKSVCVYVCVCRYWFQLNQKNAYITFTTHYMQELWNAFSWEYRIFEKQYNEMCEKSLRNLFSFYWFLLNSFYLPHWTINPPVNKDISFHKISNSLHQFTIHIRPVLMSLCALICGSW